MGEVYEHDTFTKRAHWLVNLRWVATGSVVAGTFVSANVLHIDLAELALYGVALLLAIYNAAVLILLRHYGRTIKDVSDRYIRRTINLQICVDLLLLTAIVHFSGGIENPLVFYFVFHMIISSILLSVRGSYLQATYAVLLFGLLVLLEYLGLIDHYCLKGFAAECLRREGLYILGKYAVFASALYLVVYMTGDISMKLRRAEQAHREANAQLHEKDRIKDEYVSRVTHDIKGHLATIKSCLDVVKSDVGGPLNAKQLDFVARAQKRTEKLTAFVRTLLSLTQMRLSNNLQMENFALEQTINNAMAAAAPRAAERSLALTSRLDLPQSDVLGNEFSIEEMMTNLLLNAIKYTPPSGSVEITASKADDVITVEIHDTGIGIPEEDVPRIFEEFYRAKNARKVERDGTGLGLAIAKQIVERHDGRIWVESKEGMGSAFKFTLPASSSRAKAAGQVPASVV